MNLKLFVWLPTPAVYVSLHDMTLFEMTDTVANIMLNNGKLYTIDLVSDDFTAFQNAIAWSAQLIATDVFPGIILYGGALGGTDEDMSDLYDQIEAART